MADPRFLQDVLLEAHKEVAKYRNTHDQNNNTKVFSPWSYLKGVEFGAKNCVEIFSKMPECSLLAKIKLLEHELSQLRLNIETFGIKQPTEFETVKMQLENQITGLSDEIAGLEKIIAVAASCRSVSVEDFKSMHSEE